jgi:excisionase family DNA binding protein
MGNAMPEKLLTISEAAKYLNISEDEIKRLVDIGEIPAYRIGGSFLRFRKEHLDAIRDDVDEMEKDVPQEIKAGLDEKGKPTHHISDLENEIKKREPVIRQYDYTAAERLRDFFYFNDFYLISFFIIGILLYVIFKKA